MKTARHAGEWLEADGLGGFASGPANGIRSRRYHALLLHASAPPSGRMVLVNGVEAWWEGPDGAVALSTHHYAPDTLHPDGTQRIVGFHTDPWPTWRFALPGGMHLLHDIFAAGDSGDVILRWWLVPAAGAAAGTAADAVRALPDTPGADDAGPAGDGYRNSARSGRLFVRPLLSVRDYHALHRRNDAFDFTPAGANGRISWRPYAHRPAVSALSNGVYRHAPEWFERFLYDDERERGLDAVEDLASPGIFSFDLDCDPAADPSRDAAGEQTASCAALLILRAGDSRDVHVARRVAGAERDRRGERQRRAAAAVTARGAAIGALSNAAGQYFAERGQGATLLAGFPWFTDWGRDTFISLRGLALATGRENQAAAILREWATTVSEGMLPNRFPDEGSTPEYNSVDASLWFIVALHAYLLTGHATPATRDILQGAAERILDGYHGGTRFGIGAGADGLLHAGEPGSQLTWMDARVGLTPVTPRIGKPVEIQALWINALRIGATWNPRWQPLAERAQAAFAGRFVDPASGALHDVVDVDGVAGTVDRSVRPNQILAVGGLPFQVVDDATARAVVAVVERELWTPLGLRTLACADPRYIGRYTGPPESRDSAYHQGTAWLWLAGPFIEAWLRVHARGANAEAARAEARARFVAPLDAHLREAGLGHLSEIADGDAPHTPRGAPFQAWSLAERLRIETLL
ncbi:glycogen debranching enzyme N-terminal domain-containing protein [Robbsia sp. Bb-Pol-6]|uniref:Glycogen debranching enzyme N-terminal domain-containing protein n=1 Tax=Robbsia betulipollinis TaxID=2981849 RepID=A0ABT3ZHG1_9BURK|nr:amylo-alpha-1,6-glucosidase [Robbsia betulipollinis]MCY0385961.1 glycogen debranching enzyme N-terminal domain-containing protein [Robbsia betulipollinis]